MGIFPGKLKVSGAWDVLRHVGTMLESLEENRIAMDST
jgi:hypothetical protein